MKRFYNFIDYGGPSFLLACAFFMQGVKTPLTFFIWGSVALVCCALSYWRFLPFIPWRAYVKETVLFIFICVSFFYSSTTSVSLFPTAQYLVFFLIWLWFKSNARVAQANPWLEKTVAVLAFLSVVKTLFQMSHGYAGWGRSYGFLPLNPSINAIWMTSAACFFLGRRQQKWRLLLGLILLFTVIMGPSRGTFIALACGLMYLIMPWLSWRRVLWSLAAVLFLFCVIPKTAVSQRLRLNEGNYRLKIWMVAVHAAFTHPWVGYGAGNFESAYQRYAFPVETDSIRFARTTAFAHNEYLQIASDLGIPCSLLIFWAILMTLFSRPAPTNPEARSAKAALWPLAVAAFYIPIWHYPFMLFLTLLWCGMLNRQPAPAPLEKVSSDEKGLYLIAGILVLVSLEAAIGWSALREHWSENGQWDKILRRDGRDGWALEYAADARARDCDSALPLYARAVTQAPRQADFYEAYGHMLEACRQGDYLHDALHEYAAAYALAPNRAINALAIGRLFFLRGDIENALQWFRAARRIEPHYWECDLWIARCDAITGHPDSALRTLNELTKRRAAALAYRQKMNADLPTGDDASAYSQVILAYDDRVIQQEKSKLAMISHK